MDPDEASVAMLYQDPHPAHRGFAEAVDADLIDYRERSPRWLGDSIGVDVLNGLGYDPYDVYLVEGSRPLYAAIVRRFTGRGALVYLCADHGLYELGRSGFEGDTGLKSLIGRFGRPAVRAVARRGIDGVVAVSSFAAEFTRPLVAPDAPIEVAHPYVQPDLYRRLGDVEPSIESSVVVTVGRAARYKGVDMLVDAWPAVRSSHPEATLHVVGSGHPESYADTEGVRVRGFVDDLPEALSRAALYVQPSRVDTFPVSVLEALRAGLPALVTSTTGTRSVARAVDPSLVVDPDPESIAAGVIDYLDRDPERRRALARAARERGDGFDADSRTAAFRTAFRSVVSEL